MNFWTLLYIIDWLLFIPIAGTVLYLGFFAIAALFNRHGNIPRSKQQNRFVVIIPAHQQDDVIEQTVVSVLGQAYPQRMFDITVISDHQNEMTNMRLAQYPITLLTPDFEESSKAKSLQYAVLNLPEFKIYDIVVILDADNIVEQDFLQKVNDAFEVAAARLFFKVVKNMFHLKQFFVAAFITGHEDLKGKIKHIHQLSKHTVDLLKRFLRKGLSSFVYHLIELHQIRRKVADPFVVLDCIELEAYIVPVFLREVALHVQLDQVFRDLLVEAVDHCLTLVKFILIFLGAGLMQELIRLHKIQTYHINKPQNRIFGSRNGSGRENLCEVLIKALQFKLGVCFLGIGNNTADQCDDLIDKRQEEQCGDSLEYDICHRDLHHRVEIPRD